MLRAGKGRRGAGARSLSAGAGGGGGPSYGENQVTGSFSAADGGTFATDTDTSLWKATAGASVGPGNVPGGRQNLTVGTAKTFLVEGTYKRGTATNATVVIYDTSFNLLGTATTTNTTDTAFSFEITTVADPIIYCYWGMEASATGQTAFFTKASLSIREVL